MCALLELNFNEKKKNTRTVNYNQVKAKYTAHIVFDLNLSLQSGRMWVISITSNKYNRIMIYCISQHHRTLEFLRKFTRLSVVMFLVLHAPYLGEELFWCRRRENVITVAGWLFTIPLSLGLEHIW